jgi:hypothetical protein
MQQVRPFRQACRRQRMPTRQAGGQHMSRVGVDSCLSEILRWGFLSVGLLRASGVYSCDLV